MNVDDEDGFGGSQGLANAYSTSVPVQHSDPGPPADKLEQALAVVVVDTNYCMAQLETLKRMASVGLEHRVVLVVPWVVINELDGLKKGRNLGEKHNINEPYSLATMQAREATRYLNQSITDPGLAWRGQKKIEGLDLHDDNNDDKILGCCLYTLHKRRIPTFLLTLDKNLSIKAQMNDIYTCGVWNDDPVKLVKIAAEIAASTDTPTIRQGDVPDQINDMMIEDHEEEADALCSIFEVLKTKRLDGLACKNTTLTVRQDTDSPKASIQELIHHVLEAKKQRNGAESKNDGQRARSVQTHPPSVNSPLTYPLSSTFEFQCTPTSQVRRLPSSISQPAPTTARNSGSPSLIQQGRRIAVPKGRRRQSGNGVGVSPPNSNESKHPINITASNGHSNGHHCNCNSPTHINAGSSAAKRTHDEVEDVMDIELSFADIQSEPPKDSTKLYSKSPSKRMAVSASSLIKEFGPGSTTGGDSNISAATVNTSDANENRVQNQPPSKPVPYSIYSSERSIEHALRDDRPPSSSSSSSLPLLQQSSGSIPLQLLPDFTLPKMFDAKFVRTVRSAPKDLVTPLDCLYLMFNYALCPTTCPLLFAMFETCKEYMGLSEMTKKVISEMPKLPWRVSTLFQFIDDYWYFGLQRIFPTNLKTVVARSKHLVHQIETQGWDNTKSIQQLLDSAVLAVENGSGNERGKVIYYQSKSREAAAPAPSDRMPVWAIAQPKWLDVKVFYQVAVNLLDNPYIKQTPEQRYQRENYQRLWKDTCSAHGV